MFFVFGCGGARPFFKKFVKKQAIEIRDARRGVSSALESKRAGSFGGKMARKENRSPASRKGSRSSSSNQNLLITKMNSKLFTLMVQHLSEPLDRFSNTAIEPENPVLDMYSKVQEARRNGIEITRISLTGGTKSGKTTIISRIPEKIKQISDEYIIMIAHEAAMIMFLGGGSFRVSELSQEESIVFQTEVLRMQIAMENRMLTLALNAIGDKEKPRKIVLICDRGLIDGEAYIDEDGWKQVMKNCNVAPQEINELRYDLVIHTATVFDGAENFAENLENFDMENVKSLMMEVDESLRKIYSSHPQYYYVNNQMDNLPEGVSSFEYKMRRVDSIILKYLGFPVSLDSLVKKYYLKGLIDQDLFDLLKVETKPFLILDQGVFDRLEEKNPRLDLIRVQSLVQDEYSLSISKEDLGAIEEPFKSEKRSYYYKKVTLDEKKYPMIIRRCIEKVEYMTILEHKDSKLKDVYRLRRSFFLSGQLYWIDTFLNYLGPPKDPNSNLVSNKSKMPLFSVLTVQAPSHFSLDKLIPKKLMHFISPFISWEITDHADMHYTTLSKECFETDLKSVLATIKEKKLCSMDEIKFTV